MWARYSGFQGEKSNLPYFSIPRGAATSVSIPEVRNRKETECGPDDSDDEMMITIIIVMLVEVPFPLPPNIGIGDNRRVDESDDGQDSVDVAGDDSHRDADNDNDRDISGSVDDLVNLGRGPVVVLRVEPGELPTVPGF